MRVDVWSDLVCPWCYLGRRRLDAALETMERAEEVEVKWRAFQLDPTAPDEPQPYAEMLARKYGAPQARAMAARLEEAGPEMGIDFRFDRVQRVNSRRAQRLLAWAGESGGDEPEQRQRRDQLHDRLFGAYFTEGEHLGDPSVLSRLAEEVGFSRELVSEALASGAGEDTVAADLDAARSREVTSVPTFVVAEQLAIPGAQDVDTLANLLGRALDRLA